MLALLSASTFSTNRNVDTSTGLARQLSAAFEFLLEPDMFLQAPNILLVLGLLLLLLVACLDRSLFQMTFHRFYFVFHFNKLSNQSTDFYFG